MWKHLILLVVLLAGAQATDVIEASFGPFQSNIGEVKIQVRHGAEGPQLFLEVLLRQTMGESEQWKVLRRTKVNRIEYVAPLRPDESTFIAVWSDGLSYETTIFKLQAPESVEVQLEAIGKEFPEMVRAGVEDTQFVMIRSASAKGNILDVVDIYAFDEGHYKREERVPYEQKLAAVTRISRRIDRTAAERRNGVIVHP
jgi:hypothetical protein